MRSARGRDGLPFSRMFHGGVTRSPSIHTGNVNGSRFLLAKHRIDFTSLTQTKFLLPFLNAASAETDIINSVMVLVFYFWFHCFVLKDIDSVVVVVFVAFVRAGTSH